MKIAYIVKGNIPSKYADSIHSMKMAQALTRLGHKVTLLAPMSFKTVGSMKRTGDVFKSYNITDRFTLRFIPIPSPYGLKRMARFSSFEYSAALAARLGGFDLVYARSYLAPCLTAKLGLNTIVETHNPDLNATKYGKKLQKISTLPCFPGFVVITDYIKDSFINNFGIKPEKVFCVHDGVDVKTFELPAPVSQIRDELNLPRTRPLAVYCGSVQALRGIEWVLRAAKKCPDVLFLIVGGGENDMKKFASEDLWLGVENIQFRKYAPNNNIPGYLHAADVLLAPYSTDTPTWRWMSPLKIFEYLAAGKPIITTDLPILREIITHEENGLLVAQKDVDALAGAVKRILANPALAAGLSQGARNSARLYSWERRCEKILNYFKLG